MAAGQFAAVRNPSVFLAPFLIVAPLAAQAQGTIIVEDRGTVSGTPFGKGTIDLIATFDGTHVTATYTVTTKKGKVFGTTDMTLTVVGNNLTLDGTAKITGGTKAYKGISGRGLKVLDTNTLDGQNGRITLTGKVRLPR